MRTRDETLNERMGRGFLTGGALGGALGLGESALRAPAHFMESGKGSEALAKFILQSGARTGKTALAMAAVTPLISALLHGIQGPAKRKLEP